MTETIRIGAQTLLWGNPKGEEFKNCVREAREAGYDGLSGFSHWGWEQYVEDPDSLKSLLDDQELAVPSMNCFLAEDEEFLRKVCRFMNILGCTTMVVGGGKKPEWTGRFAEYAQIVNRAGRIASDFGISVVYHNHTNNVGENYGEMVSLIDHFDPEITSVMLDVGHATKDFTDLPLEERAVRFLRQYQDRITFIEFKDWKPDSDLNTPLGTGLTPYPAVFDCVREIGYSGWIVVEQNGHQGIPGGYDNYLQCARISRECIREGLGV
jgi:sugar phosphate isomerase/epimerase